MSYKYRLIKNDQLNGDYRNAFGEMLKKQGKVKGDCSQKADRCKLICLAFDDKKLVAIGAIKPKTSSDFDINKANCPQLKEQFKWEPGYIFTEPNYQGKGLAKKIVDILIEEYGDENLMASTEVHHNPGMVKILERNGFKLHGVTWKSVIHQNQLGLYLKWQQ